jgi:hypothetical protein
MKVNHIVIALIASMLASVASAGDSATFRGQSAKYWIEFQNPMDVPDTTIEVNEWVEADFGYTKKVSSIRFKSECQASDKEIRCAKKGKSPLAGAVYRRTLDSTPSCPGQVEYRFTCVKGCTTVAPRYIGIHPYEC